MKLLKSERDFKRWAKPINGGQSQRLEQPSSYPCYGYTVVSSCRYEEDKAVYLYPDQIAEMNRRINE